MFNNQGTSKPEASQKENGDMAWACCEELVELDDVQLATVVGGVGLTFGGYQYQGSVQSGSTGLTFGGEEEYGPWYLLQSGYRRP